MSTHQSPKGIHGTFPGFRQTRSLARSDYLLGIALGGEVVQEERDLDYPTTDGIPRSDRKPWARYDRDCIRSHMRRVAAYMS